MAPATVAASMPPMTAPAWPAVTQKASPASTGMLLAGRQTEMGQGCKQQTIGANCVEGRVGFDALANKRWSAALAAGTALVTCVSTSLQAGAPNCNSPLRIPRFPANDDVNEKPSASSQATQIAAAAFELGRVGRDGEGGGE